MDLVYGSEAWVKEKFMFPEICWFCFCIRAKYILRMPMSTNVLNERCFEGATLTLKSIGLAQKCHSITTHVLIQLYNAANIYSFIAAASFTTISFSSSSFVVVFVFFFCSEMLSFVY